LEQSGDKQEETTHPSEPQLRRGNSDDTAAIENTSFSVDELTPKLRKSLTLDDQPKVVSFAAEVQSSVETDSQSKSADLADDSSTVFDGENKSFDEKIVSESTQHIADNIPCAQSEVDELEIAADERQDSNSVEFDEKMVANVDQPQSPPIAITRGNYNINWDELDENSDPFRLKKALSHSPPKSSVVSAFVGAGDSNPVAEIDPFKPSRQLTNSPSVIVGASGSSPVKQNQRRSVNNNLPEPDTDTVVSDLADSVAQSDAMDGQLIASETKTPSENMSNDKQPEVSESETTTERLNAVE